jgi:hypothetical protein
MAFSDKFIGAVGKMPFTAKHPARFMYTEATRAALRGNEAIRRSYIRRLGGMALTNDVMTLAGGVLSGLSAAYAVTNHSPSFFIETVGCALYAAGHGASGVAQHMMVRRHKIQAEAITGRQLASPAPAIPAELSRPMVSPGPISRPTLVERLVTDGGTAMTLVPVVHMAIEQLLHR